MEEESDLLDEIDCQLQQNLEDEVVQEIVKTGTDLRQYSKQIEKELKQVENKSIKDYVKESQNIASLHNQIAACDNILERMESMLLTFQSDLGSISCEIMSLQQKSVAMSQRLHNRQGIRGQLSQFIDEMAVSESLMSHILDTPVTEKDFMVQLQLLSEKINFVKTQSFRDARSCQDVRGVLENLQLKAISKVRVYLLEQIYKFRKPMANYQVTQNTLLKYKFFYQFLMSNERHVAEEVLCEYVDTMSKIYYSYFKSYSSRLMKLQYEEVASKEDLMGVEEGNSRGGVSLFGHRAPLRTQGTLFSMGKRGDVLTSQLEDPAIVPHAVASQKYPFEALFRSEHYALVDNSCREYLFIKEFFLVTDSSAQDLFHQIMGRCLALLKRNLEGYVAECYDAIALFLCAQLVLRYLILSQKRGVPALAKYSDDLINVLQPRFKYVLELHIKSVRNFGTEKFNRVMRPHYITRRYAEFSSALIGLSETFPSELTKSMLVDVRELRDEVQCFMLKMASVFSKREEQNIFLINNYDMVLGVLMEWTREDSPEVESFQRLLNQQSYEYVKDILDPYFGEFMQFVLNAEELQTKGKVDQLRLQEGKAVALADYFSKNWKPALEALKKKVQGIFPSLERESVIHQLALSRIIEYHFRFQRLFPSVARDHLTNSHQILVEMKRYNPSF
ncbi:vacuolar protein sorting-associated protein 52 homolog [Hetaerina americana]|uniref:vacuolar protein sorting-associated protein 52 homolog n=1 Tax=Hetaerina americana TaxID=62018 RepID=UPI003A7F50C4